MSLLRKTSTLRQQPRTYKTLNSRCNVLEHYIFEISKTSGAIACNYKHSKKVRVLARRKRLKSERSEKRTRKKRSSLKVTIKLMLPFISCKKLENLNKNIFKSSQYTFEKTRLKRYSASKHAVAFTLS